jgi:hypothetical protein
MFDQLVYGAVTELRILGGLRYQLFDTNGSDRKVRPGNGGLHISVYPKRTLFLRVFNDTAEHRHTTVEIMGKDPLERTMAPGEDRLIQLPSKDGMFLTLDFGNGHRNTIEMYAEILPLSASERAQEREELVAA